MNMKNIRIVSTLVVFLLLAVAGVVFVASFTIETLQSWPKALMEGRIVLYGQVVIGMSFGLASPRWQRRLLPLTVVAGFVAYGLFTWFIAGSPISRFGVLLCGILTLIIMGGVAFGEFIRLVKAGEARPKTRPPFPKGDPSRN